MIHVDFLPHTDLAGSNVAFLVDRHVLLADDPGIHGYRQEIRNVEQGQNEEVQLDENKLHFCLIGVLGSDEGNGDCDQENSVEADDTGQGLVVGVVDEEERDAPARVAERPVVLEGSVELILSPVSVVVGDDALLHGYIVQLSKINSQLKSGKGVDLQRIAAQGALLPLPEPLPHATVMKDVLGEAGQLYNFLIGEAAQEAYRALCFPEVRLVLGRQDIEFGASQSVELDPLSEGEEDVDEEEEKVLA